MIIPLSTVRRGLPILGPPLLPTFRLDPGTTRRGYKLLSQHPKKQTKEGPLYGREKEEGRKEREKVRVYISVCD